MGTGISKGSGAKGGGKVTKSVDLKTASYAEIETAINKATTVDALNGIIEAIADNEVISNSQYSDLYGKALTKVQKWQPTA